MKKLFLLFAGAIAITFSSCIGKDSTADDNNTIDDGMRTSETTLGSGSTRPSDKAGSTDLDVVTPNQQTDARLSDQEAAQRNAQGQGIHQGGIPGSADTSRIRMEQGNRTGTQQGNTTGGTRTNQGTGQQPQTR